MYTLAIANGDHVYVVDALEGVELTRAIDCTPSRLSFDVVADEILDFKEGNVVEFKENDTTIFKGFVFSKKRSKKNVISVVAYDQLRYFKNKECYLYYNKTATEVLTMICEDFKLQMGELANTQYKIAKRLEKNKTLIDIMNFALDDTLIHTNPHVLYHVYDEAGKIVLKAHDDMKLDLLIDADTVSDYDYETSIDNDTYNVVKVYREVPEGERKTLVKTGLIVDDEKLKEWGKLQLVLMPDDKDVNAIDRAKQIITTKARKTRKIQLKGVLGDVRVRGGSGVYVKFALGDIELDNYVMVEAVTHTFRNNIHLMDLTLKYVELNRNWEVKYDDDAKTLAKIKETEHAKKVKGNSSMNETQVDSAFNATEGRVSPYGSVGCADTACYAGSYYNADLAEEYKKGTASVPTLRENLEAKGYKTEPFTGNAQKGDLLIYGDDDHVVISDGNGGCFGNSSSAGYAKRYSDVNYAWGNGEAPTKVIRMG